MSQEIEELQRQLREREAECAEAHGAADDMEHLIYAISHDFRTPLRTIASYAQLLERQCAPTNECRENVAFIVKGVEEMRILIEDVLKYSRIKISSERHTMPLTPVVQWAALNLQNTVKNTGAQITFGELPEVSINESQFVQLFEQLFSNALKFRSAEAPKIEVSSEEGSDGYVISVRDNGIGVDPKYHETVFAPFKRLHGKEVPGTGLGLAICRKIVRAHGGKMWVESDGAHGATFRLTIPF